jgi:hypothetical protein
VKEKERLERERERETGESERGCSVNNRGNIFLGKEMSLKMQSGQVDEKGEKGNEYWVPQHSAE